MFSKPKAERQELSELLDLLLMVWCVGICCVTPVALLGVSLQGHWEKSHVRYEQPDTDKKGSVSFSTCWMVSLLINIH